MPPRSSHIKVQLADCRQQHQDKDQLIALLQQYITEQHQREHRYLQKIEEQQDQIILIGSENTQQKEMLIQLSVLNGEQEKMIVSLNDTVASQDNIIEKNKGLQSRLDEMMFELKMLKRHIYGHRSEKHLAAAEDENGQSLQASQISLDFAIDAWGVCRLNKRQKLSFIRGGKTITPKKPGGRHRIPDHLPEEITVLHPVSVPAGSKCIGYEDQVLIACDPLRWYKKITRRMVYLTVAEDQITHKQLIAPLPPHPIPRCKMDISALVMIAIDKYLYHMPLWRQRRRFLQYGLQLSYSTMAHDLGRIADLLEPLAHLLLKEILASGLAQFDETTYRVLDITKKKGKKSHRGWMWAAMNGVQRICCFIYEPGRGKKDIAHALQGYEGYLFTDAHTSYIKYGQQKGVQHAKCLGHVRRYFEQSMQNDRARATYALENFFGILYMIEEECKLLGLDYDAITDKRQQESVPVLMGLKTWLLQELPALTPHTPIYRAFTYALNHFDGMTVYTTEGTLPIDNNDLEREIRAIALGRNAHMFAGSHRGGEQAAVFYSLLATCKLQGIDPSAWMSDVLGRINAHPKDQLIQLLPQFWKPLSARAAQTA